MDHEIKFYFFHMISIIHNSEEKSIFRRISFSARTFTGDTKPFDVTALSQLLIFLESFRVPS